MHALWWQQLCSGFAVEEGLLRLERFLYGLANCIGDCREGWVLAAAAKPPSGFTQCRAVLPGLLLCRHGVG